MKIELKLDKTYEEPKIIITANQVTDEIKLIMDMFSDERAHVIAGFKDGDVVVLDPSDIYRIFARSGKVFAQTNQGDYTLRLRLYEIEQWLINKDFVRISNSETGVYFVIACLAMFPIAYFAYWMPHSVVGAALYVGIFIAIFAICWITQYLSIKHKVNEMNAGLNKF